jgi:hypothetical protein
MWVFLPWGYFSIVAHRDHSADVLVRARNRADLHAFRTFLLDANEAVGRHKDIKHTPHADYPFRLTAPRKQVAKLLASFVAEDLDYDNFKNRVAENDPGRAHLYHEVWATTRKIDPRELPRVPHILEIES